MTKVLLTAIVLSLLGLTSGCVTSRFQPIIQTVSVNTSADSVIIFLLERDLPPQINRLGVVTFRTFRSGFDVHDQVKQQLQQEARQREANGTYRLREGTYDRLGIVSYLLFHYAK